jgi:hypothetical protein
MEYIYPNDKLVALTIERWDRIQEMFQQMPKIDLLEPGRKEIDEKVTKRPVFPNQKLLRLILDVVYQASLKIEESRRIAVRVSYLPPGISEGYSTYNLMREPIMLTTPVNFTVDEVMRLAPALDATKSMILVCPSGLVLSEAEYPLAIWGVYHQGSEWWRLVTGKESSAICPPNCLTVSAFSPGNITATTLGKVIFRLNSGQLQDTHVEEGSRGDLSQGNVGSYFSEAVQLLYQEACKRLGRTKYSNKEDEDAHPWHRYFQTLENIANITAELHHGAAFIFVPDKNYLANENVKDSLSVKYRVDVQNVCIWEALVVECVANSRYFDLLFPERGGGKFLREMPDASASELKSLIHWEKTREGAEESIAEFASFVSSLSSIDGAVVLTKQFQLLGFGAEITIDSPNPVDVRIAKDPFGNEYSKRPVTAYGTRHRSAFRLCGNFGDCLSLIISQDGPMRVVKAIKGNTYLWDDLHTSRSSL